MIRTAALVLFVALFAALGLGCNSILGNDEHTLGPLLDSGIEDSTVQTDAAGKDSNAAVDGADASIGADGMPGDDASDTMPRPAQCAMRTAAMRRA